MTGQVSSLPTRRVDRCLLIGDATTLVTAPVTVPAGWLAVLVSPLLRPDARDLVEPVLAAARTGLEGVLLLVPGDVAAALAGPLSLPVVAPDGPVVATPGGVLFTSGGTGWWRHTPGGRRVAVGPRWPAPGWQSLVPDRTPWPAGISARPVPAGWLLDRSDPSAPLPDASFSSASPDGGGLMVDALAAGGVPFAVAVDPDRPRLLLDPSVTGTDLAAALRALPPAVRQVVDLIPLGPGQGAGRAVASAAADALGEPLHLVNGVPLHTPAETIAVYALDPAGRPIWPEPAWLLRCLPGGLEEVVASSPPQPALRPLDPATYALDLGWIVRLSGGGIHALPAAPPRPAKGRAALPEPGRQRRPPGSRDAADRRRASPRGRRRPDGGGDGLADRGDRRALPGRGGHGRPGDQRPAVAAAVGVVHRSAHGHPRRGRHRRRGRCVGLGPRRGTGARRASPRRRVRRRPAVAVPAGRAPAAAGARGDSRPGRRVRPGADQARAAARRRGRRGARRHCRDRRSVAVTRSHRQWQRHRGGRRRPADRRGAWRTGISERPSPGVSGSAPKPSASGSPSAARTSGSAAPPASGAPGSTAAAPTTAAPANLDDGVNLAAGRPTTESSHTQVYGANRVTDGDPMTYWESRNKAFPQWVQVDLGSATDVRRVVLRLPPSAAWPARTQRVAIQGSTDGASFTTLSGESSYTFDPSTGQRATITLSGGPQRYVRIVFTSNTVQPAGQLSGLELYRA